MQYRNGREANVGDPVVGTAYNTNGVIVGRIASITPKMGPTCNCTVQFVGDAAQPVKTDHSQCDNFFHADDAFALSETAHPKRAPIAEESDTNFPGYAEKLSAAHCPLPRNWPEKRKELEAERD